MLRPSLTLTDLTGPGHRLVMRASDRRGRWLPSHPVVRDGNAGGSLLVTGDMPYLTSAAVVTPRVRRIFGRAGLEIPGRIETFVDAGDYPARVLEFSEPGRLFVQHIHAPDEIPGERYWVPPQLYSFLNNKANLAEVAPASSLPDRRIVAYRSLTAAPPDLPCVIKAVTDDSTGGGLDVVVCRTPEDLREAVVRFAGLERVVIEEFLEIETSFCLHFAVYRDDRRTEYLGAVEQVCLAGGQYDGNWIDGEAVPAEAIQAAQAAVENGARRGYYGFAGIDVAVTAERACVIDLNFRFNGSSSALLLREAIRAERGDVAMRLRRWPIGGPDWESALLRVIDDGRLIPITVYDPDAGPYRDEAPYVAAVVIGEDRADVDRYTAAAV